MNYLIWNIIPGYIYSKPPKKDAVFAGNLLNKSHFLCKL